MKMIVTGGAGFIGSHFVAKILKERLSDVIVLDKLTYAGHLANLRRWDWRKDYQFVHGDIGDRHLVRELFREFRPRYVVHFAAESHVDRSIESAKEFIQTNVVGTCVLLDEALKYWRTLSGKTPTEFRFHHVSTDEVFGSLGSTGLFTEHTQYAPNSPYSASKGAADLFVRAYNKTHGLPTLVTNCCNNYGPRQLPEKLFPKVILNALQGNPITVHGDGMAIRDWIFVEDQCDAIWEVLTKALPGEVFNVGANHELTNLAAIFEILNALKKAKNLILKYTKFDPDIDYEKLIVFEKDRPGQDMRYAVDTSKIAHEIGWVAKEDFATGLQKTVEWYIKNIAWCQEVTKI